MAGSQKTPVERCCTALTTLFKPYFPHICLLSRAGRDRPLRTWKQAGADVNFQSYAGEYHTFFRDWELSMQRTVDFLRSEMGVN